ncbi:metallophosphoesterase [Aliidiomarina sp. Khilg15.8]
MTDALASPVRRLAMNRQGRDFVVGDLHGSWSLLQKGLTQVDFDTARDRLFSVGDIVDRGQESMRLLELLKQDWFYACLGNHESVLLEYQRDKAPELAEHWRQFGGSWFFELSPRERVHAATLVQQHCSFALQIETGNGHTGIVHADVPAGSDWATFFAGVADNTAWQRNCLWSRERVQGVREDCIGGIDMVVTGHQIVAQATQIGNVWLIDTGAYKENGALSILELPARLHRVR